MVGVDPDRSERSVRAVATAAATSGPGEGVGTKSPTCRSLPVTTWLLRNGLIRGRSVCRLDTMAVVRSVLTVCHNSVEPEPTGPEPTNWDLRVTATTEAGDRGCSR